MNGEWILSVEDDSALSFVMKRILESKGYRVVTAGSIAQAMEELEKRSFDLILLDMMLPDGEGGDLCVHIRDKSYCPVLFISCLSDRETKVRAMELGADDYITKPVDFEELLARIQSNLRRAKLYNLGRSDSGEERYPGILVRKKSHEVWVLDEEDQPVELLELSPTEYGLLMCFIEQSGELLLYNTLYQKVWGADDLGDVRTVKVHVSNLRKKLGERGGGLIQTVRGAGYIFGNN